MANRALDHLANRLKAASDFAVTITYRRGAASVSMTAIVGSSLLKVTDGNGSVRTLRTDRDYTFSAADLVLSGSITEPAKGDKITEVGADGVTREYTLLSPGGQEPFWRYSDSHRVRIRAHTKQTG